MSAPDSIYFEAPNGAGDSTIWRRTDREPIEILSEFQVPAEDWQHIVAAVTA